ncbi:MAG: F0F1 ATP synthase subunit B [bacterium]
MQLDFAQIVTTFVGFVIVVLILRRYAWGPVLDMLDARREKIQSDYANAEKTLGEAEDLKSDFQSKLGDIKVIEREKVQEAVKRGEAVAEGIVGEARKTADNTRVKAEQDMAIEAEKAQLALRDTVVNMAIGATEKLIGERLDDAKHRQLIEEYIDNLGEMPNA